MRQALDEQRISPCHFCGVPFAKKRHDQRFCCVEHRKQAKIVYRRVRWLDRPDRAQRNEKRRELYYKNRPEVLAKLKQWRLDNPELVKKRDHEKYERNKEKHAARVAEYKKTHPELMVQFRKRYRAKYPWKGPFCSARGRSMKKKLAFDLTYEWCEKTWTGKCALTGIPFQFGSTNHHPFSPSIDRIVPTIGYTQENCRFILYSINSLKGIGTDDEMYAIAEALAKNKPPLEARRLDIVHPGP